jgi:hypothetical protein
VQYLRPVSLPLHELFFSRSTESILVESIRTRFCMFVHFFFDLFGRHQVLYSISSSVQVPQKACVLSSTFTQVKIAMGKNSLRRRSACWTRTVRSLGRVLCAFASASCFSSAHFGLDAVRQSDSFRGFFFCFSWQAYVMIETELSRRSKKLQTISCDTGVAF